MNQLGLDEDIFCLVLLVLSSFGIVTGFIWVLIVDLRK